MTAAETVQFNSYLHVFEVVAVNVVAQEVIANNMVGQEVVANNLAGQEAVLKMSPTTRALCNAWVSARNSNLSFK